MTDRLALADRLENMTTWTNPGGLPDTVRIVDEFQAALREAAAALRAADAEVADAMAALRHLPMHEDECRSCDRIPALIRRLAESK